MLNFILNYIYIYIQTYSWVNFFLFRGTEEYFELGTDRVDIINSTLGKVSVNFFLNLNDAP